MSKEWFEKKTALNTRWTTLNYPTSLSNGRVQAPKPLPIINSSTIHSMPAHPSSAEYLRDHMTEENDAIGTVTEYARVRPYHDLLPERLYPAGTLINGGNDGNESSDDEGVQQTEWLITNPPGPSERRSVSIRVCNFMREALRSIEEKRLLTEAEVLSKRRELEANAGRSHMYGGGAGGARRGQAATAAVSGDGLEETLPSNREELADTVSRDVNSAIDKLQLVPSSRTGHGPPLDPSKLLRIDPNACPPSAHLDDWILETKLQAAGAAGSGSEVEYLNLNNHSWLPGLFFERLPVMFAAGQTLKSLLIKNTCINDAALEGITLRCTNLVELDLEGCELLTSAGVQAIGRSPGLRKRLMTLNLSFMGDGAVDHAACESLSNMQALTELSVSGASELTGAALEALVAPGNVCGLHTFRAAVCPKVTDGGLQKLMTANPLLAILDLSCLPKTNVNPADPASPPLVREEGIANGVRTLRRLRWVDFSGGGDTIGSKVMTALLKTCRLLETVLVSGCTYVEDEHLRGLAKLPMMKEIRCANCPMVSASGVGAAAQSLTMEYIDYSFCPEVDIPSLEEQASKFNENCVLVNRASAPGGAVGKFEDPKKNFGLRLPAKPVTIIKKGPPKPKAKKKP